MVAVFLVTFFAALFFVYLYIPSVWMSIMAIDESLDPHESGPALVASCTPFQESGPPVCMAKLIMLRHKMHQYNTRKRRGVSHTRQTARSCNISAKPKTSWIRFGKQSGKQYH